MEVHIPSQQTHHLSSYTTAHIALAYVDSLNQKSPSQVPLNLQPKPPLPPPTYQKENKTPTLQALAKL